MIFTSLRTPRGRCRWGNGGRGARTGPPWDGCLGCESVRDELGATVSSWRDEQAARSSKLVAEQLAAQKHGRAACSRDCRVRLATVTREDGAANSDLDLPEGSTP